MYVYVSVYVYYIYAYVFIYEYRQCTETLNGGVDIFKVVVRDVEVL